MKKKIFLIVAIMAILCCLLAISASAEDVCVGDVYYTITDSDSVEGFDGTAKVNTSNKTSTATVIKIPDSIEYGGKTYVVNSIANYAFEGNKTVQEIYILSSHITAIPEGMIKNTYDGALVKIFVDFTKIKTIAKAGFNPSNDSSGNTPRTNKHFYYDAAAYIANGSEVLITSPDFSNCTSIGFCAFQGANFTGKLTIPAGCALNGQSFRQSKITELEVNGDRNTIYLFTFQGCSSLEKITFTGKVKAFENNVFSTCTAVEEIYIDLSGTESIIDNAFVFASKYDAGNTKTQWYNLNGEKIVDISGVKKLGSSAFASSNLGSATIIWPQALTSIGSQVFRKCNITGTMYLGADASCDLSMDGYIAGGNPISLIILGKGFKHIYSDNFDNAVTAVFLADSIELTSSNIFRSGSVIYAKELTNYTTQNNNPTITKIYDGSDVIYTKTCGVGAIVYNADASTALIGTFTHTEDDGAATVPSCTTPTGTEYHCSLCDALLRYEITGDAPGHDLSNMTASSSLSCITDESKTYLCPNCSETVVITTAKATGHNYDTLSYPTIAVLYEDGTKRYTCSNFDNSCGHYYEYSYRLDPSDQIVYLVMDDGTKLSVKVSDFFNFTIDERDRTYKCTLTSFKSTFTVGETTYSRDDIYEIKIPYGFTTFTARFLNNYKISVLDFSCAKDLSFPSNAFEGNQNLIKAILGDGAILNGQTFRNNNYLQTLVIADNATINIATEIFYDADIVSELIIGNGANVTITDAQLFRNSNGATIRVGDNATVVFGREVFKDEATLTTLELGKNGNYTFAFRSFYGTGIESLVIPEGSTVAFTGNEAFAQCKSLKFAFIPSGVTALREKTFDGCTALTTVALMDVTSLANSVFSTGSDTAPLTIFHHSADAFTYTSNTFNGRGTNGIILYTVSEMTEITTVPYTIYSGIPHSQYEATLDPTCTVDGYDGYATDCLCGTIASEITFSIYSSSAEATTGSYGVHTIIPNLGGHTDKIVILYANGFDKAGEKTIFCEVCDELLVEATPTNPIFTHKGYSYKLNGTITGIQSGFDVDKEALKAYEDANSKLTFGIVIVNPSYLGDTFFKDGVVNASKGVIQVSVDIGDYSTFSCYISGFQKDSALSSLELVIAGYVYEGDASNVKFMQKSYVTGENAPVVSKVTKTDATLYTVSITNVQTNVALPEEIKEYGATE